MTISAPLEFTEDSSIARCTLCGSLVLPDGSGHDCHVIKLIRDIVREELARASTKAGESHDAQGMQEGK